MKVNKLLFATGLLDDDIFNSNILNNNNIANYEASSNNANVNSQIPATNVIGNGSSSSSSNDNNHSCNNVGSQGALLAPDDATTFTFSISSTETPSPMIVDEYKDDDNEVDEDEEEVVITKEVPSQKSADPIVIASDDEDDDPDECTILSSVAGNGKPVQKLKFSPQSRKQLLHLSSRSKSDGNTSSRKSCISLIDNSMNTNLSLPPINASSVIMNTNPIVTIDLENEALPFNDEMNAIFPSSLSSSMVKGHDPFLSDASNLLSKSDALYDLPIDFSAYNNVNSMATNPTQSSISVLTSSDKKDDAMLMETDLVVSSQVASEMTDMHAADKALFLTSTTSDGRRTTNVGAHRSSSLLYPDDFSKSDLLASDSDEERVNGDDAGPRHHLHRQSSFSLPNLSTATTRTATPATNATTTTAAADNQTASDVRGGGLNATLTDVDSDDNINDDLLQMSFNTIAPIYPSLQSSSSSSSPSSTALTSSMAATKAPTRKTRKTQKISNICSGDGSNNPANDGKKILKNSDATTAATTAATVTTTTKGTNNNVVGNNSNNDNSTWSVVQLYQSKVVLRRTPKAHRYRLKTVEVLSPVDSAVDEMRKRNASSPKNAKKKCRKTLNASADSIDVSTNKINLSIYSISNVFNDAQSGNANNIFNNYTGSTNSKGSGVNNNNNNATTAASSATQSSFSMVTRSSKNNASKVSSLLSPSSSSSSPLTSSPLTSSSSSSLIKPSLLSVSSSSSSSPMTTTNNKHFSTAAKAASSKQQQQQQHNSSSSSSNTNVVNPHHPQPPQSHHQPEEQSICYGCKTKFPISTLSYCMAGHGCCGSCMQIQVKTLLARGKKGTLKCRYIACNSFYLVSQLRNSLPTMVVEILEEKLDREYCDNAAKLMIQSGVAESSSSSSSSSGHHHHHHQDQRNDVTVRCRKCGGSGSDDEVYDSCRHHGRHDQRCDIFRNLPQSWEPMSNNEEFRLVDVNRGSVEYSWVSAMFHQTMTKPRASIIRIKHLQNPILWQFYTVKKMQMERDLVRPVNEKNLFHGTSKEAVEAICRTNFDWRLCGSHGTMYGQGSYFARDASYSHMYTDQPTVQPPPPPRHMQPPPPPLPSNILFNPAQGGSSGAPQQPQQPSHHQLPPPPPSHPHHQIIFQAFPGTSHSVSIAALQSCRFARIPVLPPGSSGAAHQQAQVIVPPPSTGPPPPAALAPFTFAPYWTIPNAPPQQNSASGPPQQQQPQQSLPMQLVRTNKGLKLTTGQPPIQQQQQQQQHLHHHLHHHHHMPPPPHMHHAHHIHQHVHQQQAVILPPLPLQQQQQQQQQQQPPQQQPTQQDHVHVMFLARVLVGEYTIGKNGYRKPPSINPLEPFGKSFDACVNDTNNPTIYVIFNSSQCYPEYIIEYTNKPRDI